MFQQLWLWTPPALLAQLLSHGKSYKKFILKTRLLCNGLGYISTARETLGESKQMSRLCACETAATCRVPAGSRATDLGQGELERHPVSPSAATLPQQQSSRLAQTVGLCIHSSPRHRAGAGRAGPLVHSIAPKTGSTLLARAEKVKQGGLRDLVHLKLPQRGAGILLLHPSSLCYAIRFLGIQTIFLKEWHALKMN